MLRTTCINFPEWPGTLHGFRTTSRRGFVGWGLLLTAAGLVAATSPTSRADVIKYDYSGVINSADPSSGVTPGTRFSGTFAYDPASKAFLAIEGLNQYISGHSDSMPDSQPDASRLTLDVGSQHTYSHTGGVQVAVFNIATPGQYGYQLSPQTSIGISNANIDGGPLLVSLTLRNLDRSVLPSLNLPATLSLTDFPEAKLVVVGNAGSPQPKTLYEGTIDTLTLQVPEPAWASLLGVAAAGWVARRRRRVH
jgi:hypothetical protein